MYELGVITSFDGAIFTILSGSMGIRQAGEPKESKYKCSTQRPNNCREVFASGG